MQVVRAEELNLKTSVDYVLSELKPVYLISFGQWILNSWLFFSLYYFVCHLG